MNIPWLIPSYQQISLAFEAGKLPHAVLFHGQAGLGKKDLSQKVASLLLCDSPVSKQVEGEPSLLLACGHCRSCTLLAADTHPDIKTVDDAEDTISVDLIRTIINWVQGHAQRSAYKVIVLSNIERMTPSAANALLKILEEPPGKTCFVLTTDKLTSLLPTIISRCQLWRIEAQSNNLGKNYLQALGYSTEQIDSALAISQGSPFKALELLEQGEIHSYSHLINCFDNWLNSTVLTEFLVSNIIKQPSLFELLLADLVKCQAGANLHLSAEQQISVVRQISNKITEELLHYAYQQLLVLNKNLTISSGLNVPLQLTAILAVIKPRS